MARAEIKFGMTIGTPSQRRIAELRRERGRIAAQIRALEFKDDEVFQEIMREVAKTANVHVKTQKG